MGAEQIQDRYWKWEGHAVVLGVLRLQKHGQLFIHRDWEWKKSEFRLERVFQDPEFVDVTEREARRIIGERTLQRKLGQDPTNWPKNCLVPFPERFEQEIDLIAQAVRISQSEPSRARELMNSVDEDSMKRWFIDVALKSGEWRAAYSGFSTEGRTAESRKRKAPTQVELEAMFQRDNWRCRYCGIRIGGNREIFVRFAERIDMPELISGRSDEGRHGVYLMLMASYDHVIPWSQGGSDGLENLVTSCWCCQFGKFKYGLDVLALDNPFSRAPYPRDSWDGLNP